MSVLRSKYASATFAGTAGAVDGYALASTSHYSSHMSGTTSQFGTAVVHLDASLLALLALILGAFFSGAALSGVVIASRVGQDRQRCIAVLLTVETALILAAIVPAAMASPSNSLAAASLLALLAGSMGLQNSIGARFLRHNQRTTHVTGTLTDIGYYAGRALLDRKRPGHAVAVDNGKLVVLARTFGSFLLGGIGCRLLAIATGLLALLMPAVLVGSLGAMALLVPGEDDPTKLD